MKKKTIGIGILIILIIIILVVVTVKTNKNNQKEEIHPIIYYSLDDIVEKPLIEDKIFSSNVKISCTEKCSCIIKKDGKTFSKELNLELSEEGNYQITVTSPNGKEKETKTIEIDRTPPEVEIKQETSGKYTITFKNVNDVEIATLTKLDLATGEMISEINLKENELQERIEINEKGYYILKVEDKQGNFVNKKIKYK